MRRTSHVFLPTLRFVLSTRRPVCEKNETQIVNSQSITVQEIGTTQHIVKYPSNMC